MTPDLQPTPSRLPSRAVSLGAAAAAMASGVAYLAIGLVRYQSGLAGNYDLGIFAQGAKSWSQGQVPASSIRSVSSLFEDHFSPITVIFGLAWRIWPDPRALIVVQAACMAVMVAIIAVIAGRRMSAVRATVVAVAYGAVKGAVAAASFDVHEVGLGAPIVAVLVWGLIARSRLAVLLSSLMLLLVKEDLGLTVIVAGGVWWLTTKERRFAVLLVAVGASGLLVAFGTIYIAAGKPSVYLSSLSAAASSVNGLAIQGSPLGGSRFGPFLLFGLTAGVVGLRNPLALLAAPTLAWRFASDNPAYWQTYFHYDLVLVPIAAGALLSLRCPRRRSLNEIGSWGLCGLAVPAVAFAVWGGVTKASTLPLLEADSYQAAPAMTCADTLGAAIPRGSRIVAEQPLGPRLVARLDVQMLAEKRPASAQWVMLLSNGDSLSLTAAAKTSWLGAQEASGLVTVTRCEGVVLLKYDVPVSVWID